MADEGYGQQDPSDSSSEYNTIMFVIEQTLALMSTAKIVQVKAVDTTAKTVDVQPLVKQLDGQGNATSHGTINGVKYLGALQAGPNAVIMDPVAGDIGLMVCCDRDISSVVAAKGEANPGSYRKYSPADGVYITGLIALNSAPTQWVKFTDGGLELADKNSNKIVSDSSGWTFTGPVKFNNAVTAQQTIDVKGATTLESTVDVKGATTLEAAVDIKGATVLESSIDVKGLSTLEGNMQLTGTFLGAGGAVYPNNMRISGTFQADNNVIGLVDVIGAGISLETHVHAYIKPGAGFTGPITATTGPSNP